MSTSFVPRGDNVFVRPQSHEEISEAGIIIPDTVEAEKPTSGVVTAVGPDVLIDVVPGSVVLFGAYATSEVQLNGETIWSLRDADIMAVSDEQN